MKTIKLNWQDLTEENITKLYLYGDLNDTHDLTSPEIHREGSSNDADSAQVNIELNNFYDYMTNPQSPMRYANLSQIPVVDKFFNEKNTIIIPPKYPDISGTVEMRDNVNRLQEGTYSLNEVREHFNDPENKHANNKHYTMQHMNIDPLSKDYDKRVYVFNSQAIHLGNEAKFVVEPNGERYIKNAAPTIGSEDFDFVSREPHTLREMAVKTGNDNYLIPNIDPLGIGRTVNISYPQGGEQNATTGLYDKNPAEYTQYIQDYAKAHGNYTKEKFEDDLANAEHEHSPVKGVANVLPAMSRVVDHLWDANTTKFLDKDGNVMLYDKEGLDSVYDGNSNMQNYIEENRNAKYHLVDKNGTEDFTEIPRGKEFEFSDAPENNYTQPTHNHGTSSILPHGTAVSNEDIAEFAREAPASSQEICTEYPDSFYHSDEEVRALAKENSNQAEETEDNAFVLPDEYTVDLEDIQQIEDDYGMER